MGLRRDCDRLVATATNAGDGPAHDERGLPARRALRRDVELARDTNDIGTESPTPHLSALRVQEGFDFVRHFHRGLVLPVEPRAPRAMRAHPDAALRALRVLRLGWGIAFNGGFHYR